MSIRERLDLEGGRAAGWVRTSVVWLICAIGLVAVPFLSLPAQEVHWTVFRGTYTGADLSITKLGLTLANPGGPFGYIVGAINFGPEAVTGATIEDIFPAGLGPATWTCAPENGATCAPNGSGDIIDTVDLPPGGIVTYTVSVALEATEGTLVNTATVTVPVGITDPDPSNDSSTVITVVAIFADGFESGNTLAWSSTTP